MGKELHAFYTFCLSFDMATLKCQHNLQNLTITQLIVFYYYFVLVEQQQRNTAFWRFFGGAN
jgi:hypothetical protein